MRARDSGCLMKKTHARFSLLLPGLLALSTTAQGEDSPLILDPSVVTGSRSASPTFDLPYSVDGISREQIGAWLMRYWDMPDELSTALRFQHDPTYDGQYAEYPNLVCLAVRLLRSRGIGSGPDESIPDALLERLGLSREKAEDVVGKVLDAEVLLRELASQFSQG